jgi:hypothetical protein
LDPESVRVLSCPSHCSTRWVDGENQICPSLLNLFGVCCKFDRVNVRQPSLKTVVTHSFGNKEEVINVSQSKEEFLYFPVLRGTANSHPARFQKIVLFMA